LTNNKEFPNFAVVLKSNLQFWIQREMPADKVCLWRLGNLRLWILREDSEWALAEENGESHLIDCTFVPPDVTPQNVEWKIFAFDRIHRNFFLEPHVPDRPVVLRPDFPVTLPPGESALYFARIPIHVQFKVIKTTGTQEEPILLSQIASYRMSDTWFGSPEEGEFCYAARMTARRNLDDLEAAPNHLVVPLELHNESRIDLRFEKVCLRLQYSDIFAGRMHLWGNRVKVTYRGKEPLSEVSYGKEAPDFEPALKRIVSSVEKAPNIIRRSFGWIGRQTQQLMQG